MPKNFTKKHKSKKKVTHPDRAGKRDGIEYTLGYNKSADRYSLKGNGKLILSNISHAACLRKAGHGINWKIAKDSDG